MAAVFPAIRAIRMEPTRTKLLCLECFVLGALGMLLLATLEELPFAHPSVAQPAGQWTSVHRSEAVPAREKLPPCGKIESIAIPFAHPDGVFPDRSERLQQPKWLFEGFSETSLSAFL